MRIEIFNRVKVFGYIWLWLILIVIESVDDAVLFPRNLIGFWEVLEIMVFKVS